MLYMEENNGKMSCQSPEGKSSKKRLKSEREHVSSEDMSHDMVELMDLPELVLIQIFSYLGHDFLRHVVSKVSMECKRLAASQVLWSQASLSFSTHVIRFAGASFKKKLEAEKVEEFVRDILVTPYLHHLWVDLKGSKRHRKEIQAALLSTRCRIHKLELAVYDYCPEILLFLQQHPEIRELQLEEARVTDNGSSIGVAACVGRLAPRLLSLSLSLSSLLFLPKAGLLLASPSLLDKDLSESSMYFPRGSELQCTKGALDLRDPDNYSTTVKQDKQQGLLQLKFFPSKREVSCIAAKNVSAFLRAHKHALKSAKVSPPSQDVWQALAECTKLEELAVACDPDGSSLCAMLQTMKSSPRRLDIYVPKSLGAKGLATVLDAVCRHAPRLETLKLDGGDVAFCSPRLFPGFRPLQPLLVAALRELRISHMGPVGRADLLELASMATCAACASATLSLRTLDLGEMCSCTADLADLARERSEECRTRAEAALKSAAPSLEYYADACSCGVTLTSDSESE